MPIIEGTQANKIWRGSYSFAVDTGAVATYVLRSNDGAIPSGAVVKAGYMDVTIAFTTAAAGTGALQVNAANDLVSATIVSGAPFSTTGIKDLTLDSTGSTMIKTTAARSPSFLIGTGAITAGAFTLTLEYI